MKKSDLISVIVPVYNAERDLDRCLLSLLNQTYENLEIICVDDGSKDKSGDILEEFAKRDGRIKVYHQRNQGALQSRKNGIAKISEKSKYFSFCDADDLLPKNAIQILYECIENDRADICVGNTVKIFRNFLIKNKYIPKIYSGERTKEYSHDQFIAELYCSWFGISNVPVGLWGKLYKTKKYQNLFINLPEIVYFFGEDLVATLNMFPIAEKVSFTNDVVYQYRLGGGTSKFQPLMMNDWISLYNYKKQFAKKYPMPQDIEFLMDIELCNMTFTYFEMLIYTSGFTKENILKEIEKTCNSIEVKIASNNSKLIEQGYIKAKLLREIKINEVYDFLTKKGWKNRLYRKVKKILFRFS